MTGRTARLRLLTAAATLALALSACQGSAPRARDVGHLSHGRRQLDGRRVTLDDEQPGHHPADVDHPSCPDDHPTPHDTEAHDSHPHRPAHGHADEDHHRRARDLLDPHATAGS